VNRIEGMEREGAIYNNSGKAEEGVQNSVLFVYYRGKGFYLLSQKRGSF